MELILHIDDPYDRSLLMIKTVASIAQVKLNIQQAQVTTDGDAPSPNNMYLVIGNNNLFDVQAIVQYIASLNPSTGLNGRSPFQEAKVNEWMCWCQTKWLPVMQGPLLSVLGQSGKDFDKEKYDEALDKVMEVASQLDQHLKNQKGINSSYQIIHDDISVADVFIGSCFITMFQTLFDASARKDIPHLTAWFGRVTKHPAFFEFFGSVKQCDKAMAPSAANGAVPTASDALSTVPPVASAAPPVASAAPAATGKMKQQTVNKQGKQKKDDVVKKGADEPKSLDDLTAKITLDIKNEKDAKVKIKKQFTDQSFVKFEVMPADRNTDLDKIAKEIFKIKMNGLSWQTEYKKEPSTSGSSKLLIDVSVDDSKVSVDLLQDKMEDIANVEHADILAINKM